MDPRYLGRSGLQVSPLALGTVNFGHVTAPRDAHAIMSAALDHGVFFFDTANIYNYVDDDTCTEAIVGAWLRAEPARRRRIVLNSKVYGTIGDGPNDRGLSARHIQLECERTLRRLGTDWLDVYTLHHVDRETPWEETLDALERLRQAGKVLYYATSNFAAWHTVSMHLTARAQGRPGPLFEQSHYNLRTRDVERDVLPACRHYGLGFVAYSPLAEGLLAGPGDGRRRGFPTNAARRDREWERLQAWYTACAAHGIAPPHAALGWLLAQPDVSAAVVGPRTRAQLDDAVAAARRPLDAAALAAVSEPWPGHVEAPEAYAW